MNHIPHASICIFINKENELLMIKRSENLKTYPGIWAFPGGKIDKGEDAVEAAIREAEEEVGLYFDRYNCNYIWSDIKPNGKEICFFVITDWSGSVTINDESTRWKWCSIEDLRYLKMIPISSHLMEKTIKFF